MILRHKQQTKLEKLDLMEEFSKETHQIGENICKSYIWYGLISRVYKELLKTPKQKKEPWFLKWPFRQAEVLVSSCTAVSTDNNTVMYISKELEERILKYSP
jgi:hypothetical protein